MKEYIPLIREEPDVLWINATWGDTSSILKDIILRFKITPRVALEFGVATGHSISALACYFNRVLGVDNFRNSLSWHNPAEPSQYYDVLKALRKYNNIQLIGSLYEDFIQHDIYEKYDLIHVDIMHYYKDTFDCGSWALQHSDVVLFHDTNSFPEVGEAVRDLSIKYGFEFYNYMTDKATCGLGILVKNG
jgi:hypothetical protein